MRNKKATILGIIGTHILPASGTMVEQVMLNCDRVGKRLTMGNNSGWKKLGLEQVVARPSFKDLSSKGIRIDLKGTMFHEGQKVSGVYGLPFDKFNEIIQNAKQTGQINLF